MSGRGNALPAAVYTADDPRARNSARQVPETAEMVTLGTTTLGYVHKPANFQADLSWQAVMAYQRRNELARLVTYRDQYGIGIGPALGWAHVLADITAALDREVNVTSLEKICRSIRLSATIDLDIMAGAANAYDAKRHQKPYRMLSAASVGAYIELTSVEREDLNIRRMDAWDEPSEERKRRLDRERQAKKRGPSKPRTKFEPWRDEGISRATWYRRTASGTPARKREKPN